MAFSGLVYRKRGRDASPWFYVAPTGLDCSLLLLPRAMPWATIFRPFGAKRNPLYSNPENGLIGSAALPAPPETFCFEPIDIKFHSSARLNSNCVILRLKTGHEKGVERPKRQWKSPHYR